MAIPIRVGKTPSIFTLSVATTSAPNNPPPWRTKLLPIVFYGWNLSMSCCCFFFFFSLFGLLLYVYLFYFSAFQLRCPWNEELRCCGDCGRFSRSSLLPISSRYYCCLELLVEFCNFNDLNLCFKSTVNGDFDFSVQNDLNSVEFEGFENQFLIKWQGVWIGDDEYV